MTPLMKLAILKVVGAIVIVLLYLAATATVLIITRNMDLSMTVGIIGAFLAGGALLGINLIDV